MVTWYIKVGSEVAAMGSYPPTNNLFSRSDLKKRASEMGGEAYTTQDGDTLRDATKEDIQQFETMRASNKQLIVQRLASAKLATKATPSLENQLKALRGRVDQLEELDP